MTLPLTPETLRAAYDFLATTPPFNRWNLPDGEDIRFSVATGKANYGWHDKKRGRKNPHVIVVSGALVGRHSVLLSTVAHEMIHLHIHQAKIKDSSMHGVAFNKIADAVCKIHEFDRKTF